MDTIQMLSKYMDSKSVTNENNNSNSEESKNILLKLNENSNEIN